MSRVVTRLDELTPAWLTDCLADRYPGIEVRAAHAEPLDAGQNYVGNLALVTLTDISSAPDAPRRLVAKLVPENEAARALGAGMGIYIREALFYATLADSVPSGAPDCHGMAFDLETGLAVMLLEDLTHLAVGVQSDGFTPARARATVLQLADQHAAFWQDDAIAELPWLPVWNQPEMVAFVGQSWGPAWQACQAAFAGVLTPDDIALGDLVGVNLPLLMDAIGTPPVTLLHGDSRYDNLLFDRGDGNAPPRTVDWQFVARGRGMQDVAYFLTQSGTAEVAAAHERELVEAYHARLAERLGGRAGGDVDGGDFDAGDVETCWRDYRLFALYSLVYPVFATGMVDPSNATQVAATGAILRRGFDAARRLDSVALLPG